MSDDPSLLADRVPCGLLTMTRTGEVLNANKYFLDWMGTDRIGDLPSFHESLRVGDRIYWQTHVAPLLDMQGRVTEIALELSTPNGELPVLLAAHMSTPGDPSSSIDVALFSARDRRRYESELLAQRKLAEASEAQSRLLATTLQESLIPPRLPVVPGLEVAARYVPAGEGHEVGGDWYDLFRAQAGRWVVSLGDVCGKGPRAAALTASMRFTIRGAAMETESLETILEDVNEVMLQDNVNEIGTVILGTIETESPVRDLTFSSAGHPLPLLVPAKGEPRIVGTSGTILGAFDNPPQSSFKVSLAPGESILLYSDGVTDARKGAELFGIGRLIETLAAIAEQDPNQLVEAVVQACTTFQDDEPHDDIAVMAMHHPAA